ncbi:hypothetical protein NAH08_10225, partial [Francisella tularensis subsp. holarctica]|nr:hypothetical protein [Francisella tularensis subsp. holarctica]
MFSAVARLLPPNLCLKVGFIGWRRIVGSVLMSLMIESKVFECILPTFFSTSQV